MKMKLNRIRLIKALEKAKVDAQKQYESDIAAHAGQQRNNRSQYIANVATYLRDLRGGTEIEEEYEVRKRFEKGWKYLSEPKKPKPEYIDALVAELGLSDDEYVICDNKEDYVKLTRAINVSACVCH